MLPSNMLQNADEINKTLVPGKVVAQHKRWHQPEIFPLLPKSKCCDCPGEPGRWVQAWLCRGWVPWWCGSPVLCVYTFRNFMSHLCIKSSHLTNSCLKCHVWHPLTILSKQGHCLVTVTDTLCCQVTGSSLWADISVARTEVASCRELAWQKHFTIFGASRLPSLWAVKPDTHGLAPSPAICRPSQKTGMSLEAYLTL